MNYVHLGACIGDWDNKCGFTKFIKTNCSTNDKIFLIEANPKNIQKLKLVEIIKILNLESILNKYPHQVSAGEAQRASLARSLNSNPDLLNYGISLIPI